MESKDGTTTGVRLSCIFLVITSIITKQLDGTIRHTWSTGRVQQWSIQTVDSMKLAFQGLAVSRGIGHSNALKNGIDGKMLIPGFDRDLEAEAG